MPVILTIKSSLNTSEDENVRIHYCCKTPDIVAFTAFFHYFAEAQKV
jgi:hypothetical protein